MSLQQFFVLFRRSEVVPDVVVKHFPASTHPLSHPYLITRMITMLLSLAPSFTCFCPPRAQQQSLQKAFSFLLLLSLLTAPIKLLAASSLTCMETKNRFFLHFKEKEESLPKLLLDTHPNGKGLKRKQESTEPAATAAYESFENKNTKLKYKKDVLEQLNVELVQKALSASQKRSGKILDNIFSSLPSGMLGIAIKVDQSLQSWLCREVREFCAQTWLDIGTAGLNSCIHTNKPRSVPARIHNSFFFHRSFLSWRALHPIDLISHKHTRCYSH